MANPSNSASSWEGVYRHSESLWGSRPDPTLTEYVPLVPVGRALDLGVGEGRNALFLATRGYRVEGVDISETALERCVEQAAASGLEIELRRQDLRSMQLAPDRYVLIVATWLLNFFSAGEIQAIVEQIKRGLEDGGFVYLSVFTRDDPGYERAMESLERIDEGTFASADGASHLHFFTYHEVVSLFSELDLIYCAEGVALDVGHGEPHYHGFVTYMGQRSG